MPRHSRLEVLNRVLEIGLVPVFHHNDASTVCEVALACAAAGVTVFEFTNRGDHAIDAFAELHRRTESSRRDLVLGAGSVGDAATAALYAAHGASFIVGPSFNAEVARFCNRRKLPYFPGCLTPTEISVAEEYGVEIVKLFPAVTAGPEFVRAVLGPSPWTRIMPTGMVGLDQAQVARWFDAGICAMGVGRELIPRDAVQSADYEAITTRAAEVLGWVRASRK